MHNRLSVSQPNVHQKYGGIFWTREFLEKLLFDEFPALQQHIAQKTLNELISNCIFSDFESPSTTQQHLQPHLQPYVPHDVAKAMMHIRLNELDKAIDSAWKAFLVKVAIGNNSSCSSGNVNCSEHYIHSRLNINDTKRYILKIVNNPNWGIPEEIVEYFEINQMCENFPDTVYEVFDEYKDGDRDKALSTFICKICFLNDNPYSFFNFGGDVRNANDFVFSKSLEKIIMLFYELTHKCKSSIKGTKKYSNDKQRLGNIIENLYKLLEANSLAEFKSLVVDCIKNTSFNSDKHLYLKLSRRIFMLNSTRTLDECDLFFKELPLKK